MGKLSLLMIERMDRVTAREPRARANARLQAIGRAYIDFARAEPGWFRTAFSSARAHAAAGTSPSGSVPNPYEVLTAGLDELVEVGGLTPERRVGAEYAAWSAVHGLSSLLLDGPLHALPEDEVQRAIGIVLGVINSGLGQR